MKHSRPVKLAAPPPAPKVQKTRSSTTTEVQTITVPGVEVLHALRFADIVPEARKDETITVTIRVPGGGDWSNESLDLLDSDASITVTITTTQRIDS